MSEQPLNNGSGQDEINNNEERKVSAEDINS